MGMLYAFAAVVLAPKEEQVTPGSVEAILTSQGSHPKTTPMTSGGKGDTMGPYWTTADKPTLDLPHPQISYVK